MIKDKREINGVAEQLKAFGFTGSLMLLPPMLPDAEAEATYASRFDIEKPSETLWYFKSLRDPERVICKVQRKSGDRVTGNCQSFKSNRAGACGHSAYYCLQNDLPVPGPYLLSRRLEAAQILHWPGRAAVTRDNRARQDEQMLLREHLYRLCLPLKDPRPRKRGGGQPRFPYRALVYTFLVQVAEGYTDVKAAAQMANDPWFQLLTGDRSHYKKNGGPSDETLSKLIWSYPLYEDVQKLLALSAACGKRMDSMVDIDATGFGSTKLGNWFAKIYSRAKDKDDDDDMTQTTSDAEQIDQAPGGKVSAFKRVRGKGFIKVHTIHGVESGLIYGVDCTLDFGPGTSDTRHFQTLLRKVLDINSKIRVVLADKGYWKAEHFEFAQRLGILLMVMRKKNVSVDNAEVGRESIAFLEYLRLNHPAVYRTFYRYRQAIEAVFSGQKRVTGHIRRRVRKKERERIEGLQTTLSANASIDWRAMEKANPEVKKPRNWEDAFSFAAALIAQEIVGRAQFTEANAMGIAYNLREIIKWELQTGEKMDLWAGSSFTPIRRVHLPSAS